MQEISHLVTDRDASGFVLLLVHLSSPFAKLLDLDTDVEARPTAGALRVADHRPVPRSLWALSTGRVDPRRCRSSSDQARTIGLILRLPVLHIDTQFSPHTDHSSTDLFVTSAYSDEEGHLEPDAVGVLRISGLIQHLPGKFRVVLDVPLVLPVRVVDVVPVDVVHPSGVREENFRDQSSVNRKRQRLPYVRRTRHASEPFRRVAEGVATRIADPRDVVTNRRMQLDRDFFIIRIRRVDRVLPVVARERDRVERSRTRTNNLKAFLSESRVVAKVYRRDIDAARAQRRFSNRVFDDRLVDDVLHVRRLPVMVLYRLQLQRGIVGILFDHVRSSADDVFSHPVFTHRVESILAGYAQAKAGLPEHEGVPANVELI